MLQSSTRECIVRFSIHVLKAHVPISIVFLMNNSLEVNRCQIDGSTSSISPATSYHAGSSFIHNISTKIGTLIYTVLSSSQWIETVYSNDELPSSIVNESKNTI